MYMYTLQAVQYMQHTSQPSCGWCGHDALIMCRMHFGPHQASSAHEVTRSVGIEMQTALAHTTHCTEIPLAAKYTSVLECVILHVHAHHSAAIALSCAVQSDWPSKLVVTECCRLGWASVTYCQVHIQLTNQTCQVHIQLTNQTWIYWCHHLATYTVQIFALLQGTYTHAHTCTDC